MRALKLGEGGGEREALREVQIREGEGQRKGAEFQLGWGFSPVSEENWVGVGIWWIFPSPFFCPPISLLPLRFKKNCGVVQTDTLCGVPWNLQVCLSHHPVPKPEGGSQDGA